MSAHVLPSQDSGTFNRYGHFLEEDASFRITQVRTPRPWINVMSNDRYGLVLSQAGGGFSWFGDCQNFRLTRWDQDLVTDRMGRFLYVQDLAGTAPLRSTTYQPTRVSAEKDEVLHGLGFTTFHRRFADLETRHTVFVPMDADAEVWIVEVENLLKEPRKLRLCTYLEWHLGGVGDWHREFHRLFMESRVSGDALVAWKHANLREGRRDAMESPRLAFVAFPGRGADWITDKYAFLGPVGDSANPSAFETGLMETASARWDDPIAAGSVEVHLGPNESATVVVVVGAAESNEAIEKMVRRFTVDEAQASLEATKNYWRQRCAMGIETGDRDIDLLANSWLPYQAIAGRLYARCAYYQQGGAYGYRDQLQDSLLWLETEPESCLRQLHRHAEAMYDDGGVRHWWFPNAPISSESHHSDTCCWLAYGLLEYVEATGRFDDLHQNASYLFRSGGPSQGTLLDHLLRGLRRALSHRSERGIPLIGAGDWNDGLSHAGLDGKGESVWMAMFLFDILTRWQPRMAENGLQEVAEEFSVAATALQEAVETHAWDGEWYIAGTRDDGLPFGSRENREGSIFLNPQTWAVLSGIASPERAQVAMQSVRDRLIKPYGALVLNPAYSKVDPFIGYITRYAPGLRENGGVYSHASTWAIRAFLKMGDRETALMIYRAMLPSIRSAEDPERYAAEPYVMPGNVDGPDSPYEGRAGWTWYTGSAAWMVRVAREIARRN